MGLVDSSTLNQGPYRCLTSLYIETLSVEAVTIWCNCENLQITVNVVTWSSKEERAGFIDCLPSNTQVTTLKKINKPWKLF